MTGLVTKEHIMHAADATALAHRLYEAQGNQAIVEAAQKAVSFEKGGDTDQAKFWRQVEGVLLEIRGPRQS